MDSVDSAQVPVIAQLCPLQYGSVVYKARALYTAIFNDLRVWCEGCDLGQQQQQRPRISADGGEQLYSLHPNPNDGRLVLRQLIADTAGVQVSVSDMLGRKVFDRHLRFRQASYPLDISGVAPGLYITTITDHAGRKYIIKFVKQ